MNDFIPEILLIDDDALSRAMLRTLLRKASYQVIEAQSGDDGLSLCQTKTPALVLLDAKMPGMDGFDCCRRIRQLPAGEHVPILMVTGLDDSSSVQDAFKAGATDYITKPVQMPVLVGRIGYLIQSTQAEQALRASEEKYRSLIDSLQEVIFQLDAAGTLIFLNPVWHQLTDQSLSHSLGQPFQDFLHPAEQQRHHLQFTKAWQQPHRCHRYRSRCLTKAGRVRWVDIQLCATLNHQGQVINIAGRLNDITDRTIREHYRSLEYTTTRILSHANDVRTALRRAVQAICSTLGFQLGEFWQLDAQTHTLNCYERWYLKTASLKVFSDFTDTISLQPDEGIPGQAWQSDQVVWITDVSQDPLFLRQDAAKAAGLCSVLGCPVGIGTEKLGVMMFFSQTILPPDTELVRMLTILGRQLSQYLKRQQAEEELHQQNQRLHLELQRAAEYVEGLLPNSYDMAWSGCAAQHRITVQTQYQPSSALGGDAFDYTWLDDEHFMFHLLDVAGHGVKSALLSVSILNVLRKRTLRNADLYQPETVLAELNTVFQASDSGDDYFTLWYGVYNAVHRQLTFASAGHPPAVLVVATDNGYETCFLDSAGIPVGLLPDFPFEVKQCDIPAGSSLYVFSDGVYEIPIDHNHRILGIHAWAELLRTHKGIQTSSLQPLLDEVRRIHGQETLDDDFSVLEVSFA